MSELVKIPLNELRKGMVVARFDKSGFTYPYYGKPFPGEAAKKYLRENGVNYAFVRMARKDPMHPAPVNSNPAPQSAVSAGSDLAKQLAESIEEDGAAVILPSMDDLRSSIEVHRRAKVITKQILIDTRLGKMVNTEAAKGVVSSLVDQCVQSPEAFVSITRLKDFDDYTFTHSVNVSVLAIAIGRRLGASAQDMNELGFAGLLHDIGKMRIPEHILNKPDKLTPEEYEVMKQHTTRGYDYLRKDTKISKDVLAAVKYHHEKSDGTGYPDGLTENNIPKYAKILSIADVYDAITSERVYHKGMLPNEAVKAIFGWAGKHFNNALVKFFISTMGIYPVGTLVSLDTGELAVIVEPNKADPMRPKVLIVSDSSTNRIDPQLFDLSIYNVLTNRPYKTIISSLNPQEIGINTNGVIEKYLEMSANA